MAGVAGVRLALEGMAPFALPHLHGHLAVAGQNIPLERRRCVILVDVLEVAQVTVLLSRFVKHARIDHAGQFILHLGHLFDVQSFVSLVREVYVVRLVLVIQPGNFFALNEILDHVLAFSLLVLVGLGRQIVLNGANLGLMIASKSFGSIPASAIASIASSGSTA